MRTEEGETYSCPCSELRKEKAREKFRVMGRKCAQDTRHNRRNDPLRGKASKTSMRRHHLSILMLLIRWKQFTAAKSEAPCI